MEGTNLLGKSHKKYVQDQIKIRQEKLGKFSKDSTDIAWMNGKTSWVRLASSVNIENSEIRIPLTSREIYKDANYKAGGDTTNSQNVSPGINKIIEINLNSLNEEGLIGVDVEVPTGNQRLELLNLPESFMGSSLAERVVLVGGAEVIDFTSTDNNTVTKKTKRKGIEPTPFPVYQGQEFGLVAMPGIQSVDVKSKSMGSLREANISIRVNDPRQLEIIETLYLRLGYSMFLEWGNSSYFKNDGEYVKGVLAEPGLIYDFLQQKTPTQKEIDAVLITKMLDLDGDGVEDKLDEEFIAEFERRIDNIQIFQEKIEKAKKDSCGNYDALFAKVTNFSWEFDPSGFYNVTLTMISWGDIIESLSINSFYPDVTLNIKDDGSVDRTKVDRPNASALEAFIHEATTPNTFIRDNSFIVYSTTTEIQTVTKSTLISTIDKKVKLFFASIEDTQQSASDYSDKLNYNREATNSKGKIISCNAAFGKERFYYLRFGDLLDFIKTKLLIYNVKSPIIDIDTRLNKNFCYNPGINISANPKKVMIKRELPLDPYAVLPIEELDALPKDYKVINGPFTDELDFASIENFDSKIPGTDVIGGDIMNIYFEKNFLYEEIDRLRDSKTGKMPLFKFIKSLLSTANECLGGVNQLDLRVKDDRIVEIYDQVPLYGVKQNDNENLPQQFNIYGINENDGSFVSNFGLKTELTNDFATTVAIGAQANGEIVGEDSTMLSKWNFGLVDRFIPKKVDSIAVNTNDKDKELKEALALTEKIKQLWSRYQIQITDSDDYNFWFPAMGSEQFTNYTKLQQNFLSSIIKLETNSHSSNPNRLSNQMGMLPINLNLEMDGLSGIRIYDQIHVDTRFLPSYYPNYLVFIIKGVSQSFNGNRWITKIDTIAQPKVQFQKDLNLKDKFSYGPLTAPNESTPQPPSEVPNATTLRATLDELGYLEKGQEISEAGDITFSMAEATSAVFRTINSILPSNVTITVTSGNDAEHAAITDYTSFHTIGNSIDFVVSPSSNSNIKEINQILLSYAADPSSNFSYIDEYANPTKAATGKHFHLVMGGGRLAKETKTKALALAASGQITPRSISSNSLQQKAIEELNRANT